MPIGVPRFSAGNQTAMTDGAITAINPMPLPSITRLAINRPALDESAPTAEPTIRQASAIVPSIFGPSFSKNMPAGSAKKKPVKAKTDINQPACPRESWKASIMTGINGGTLAWFNGAAMLARKTTTRITQA